MIPLLLLGTPVAFEHHCALEPRAHLTQNSPPSQNSKRKFTLLSPPWLSSVLTSIEKHDLMQSMHEHLGLITGISLISEFNTHINPTSVEMNRGLCLLLACCEPQECLADWREAIQTKGLDYQVIHGSIEDLSERILLALSAHAQKLGLTETVLRVLPKERPRMGPCECCGNAECERKLFDFLTQTAH